MRVHLAAGLAVALVALAAGPAAAQTDAWLMPLVDLEGYVLGAELAATGPRRGGQLQAAVGWGLDTRRWHYRLSTLVDLGRATEVRLGWVDWADVTLPGQAREQGLFGELVWEPTVRERWSLRAFYGRVGTTPEGLDTAVLYGRARYDSWLVQGWPLSVRLRATLTYGRAEPAASQSGPAGPFHFLQVTLPVQVEYLRLIGRAGLAAGEDAPQFQFQVGGYGDGWLRGYEPGEHKGSVLLGLNVEYRRAWLHVASLPLLSLVEVGPFVDVMATAARGTPDARLSWLTSYGLTAAVPLGV
ncbi:MAG TPA: hypothetical protein VIL11_00235, partial [Limnochordales bacterium]